MVWTWLHRRSNSCSRSTSRRDLSWCRSCGRALSMMLRLAVTSRSMSSNEQSSTIGCARTMRIQQLRSLGRMLVCVSVNEDELRLESAASRARQRLSTRGTSTGSSVMPSRSLRSSKQFSTRCRPCLCAFPSCIERSIARSCVGIRTQFSSEFGRRQLKSWSSRCSRSELIRQSGRNAE